MVAGASLGNGAPDALCTVASSASGGGKGRATAMGHSGAALNGAPEKAAPSPQILLLPGPAGAAPPSTTGAHSPTSESYPDIVLLLLPVPRSRATPLLCPSRTDAAETPCPPLIPKISTDPNPAVREEGFRETPSLRYCSSGGGFLRGLAPACEPPVHLPTRTVAHWCPLTTRCLRVARHPLYPFFCNLLHICFFVILFFLSSCRDASYFHLAQF